MENITLMLISIAQLLLAAALIITNKRLDDMPHRLAWECKEVALKEKIWAKRWRCKYEEALDEIEKLQNELLAAADDELLKGEKQ